MKPISPALVVVLAGVAAALHVGKLSPALPVLRDALGITLVEAGFLLSLVQLAGMSFGLLVGLAADSLGLRRTMVAGSLLLGLASAAGGWATGSTGLMLLRAIEGAGFLMVAMPAPSLIRRLVSLTQISATLGLWGAYMPLGTATALLCGPPLIAAFGWQHWWWGLAAVSVVMALALVWMVPPDLTLAPFQTLANAGFASRLVRTLASPGPWLVALSFAMYSGQWLAVIGFLPYIYAEAQLPAGLAATLTAAAAAVNIIGNVASGRLLQRGVAPHVLLYWGFAAMGLGAVVAFATLPGVGTMGRYVAVLVFSMLGGLIPATLFSLSVRLAPDAGTVSTTVGLMHQCSSLGQFVGPPVVGWMASVSGGWQWTGLITGLCAVCGAMLAWQIGRRRVPATLESGIHSTYSRDPK